MIRLGQLEFGEAFRFGDNDNASYVTRSWGYIKTVSDIRKLVVYIDINIDGNIRRCEEYIDSSNSIRVECVRGFFPRLRLRTCNE